MENNFQIDSASVSDRGLSKKRPQNEDSFLEMNSRGLFAVADGVGGAQAGDVASQMAMEILGEAFVNLQENGDVEELMKVAIERANEAIYQMSHDLKQLSTMATTIVALHIAGNIATIGHVGDSRLYRLDPNGKLYRETQDHSVVEEEVRAGRMTAAQAATHPSRNVISRALGADYAVEIDMKTIMFEPHTTFFLCSDGITRHIDDFELCDLLLSGDNPANIVQKMKDICYQRGAEDNLTAVVAKVTDVAAEKFNGAKNEIPAEYEEATIATTRPPAVVEDAVFAEPSLPDEEVPTQNLQSPMSEELQTREVVQTNQIENPETEKNRNIFSFPAESADNKPIQRNEIVREDKTYFAEEKAESSILGKIITPLLTFFLGGLLFAGIYHLWAQNNVEPEVPQLVQQSPDIPFKAFEDNRRNVDGNPRQYIATNLTSTPEDAEDFYLMGRAYLLIGKFPEAKEMFLQAKDRLAQTSEVNNKVLANDIILSLAVINDEFAKREVVKELNLNISNTNMQTNSNNSANSFRSVQNFNGR
ncbi:MAG: protein phosphatase 2C domain-containing protein [Acidobacteriota bacterium]